MPPFAPTAYYTANVVDTVHTYLFGVTHALIPNKLDVGLTYRFVFERNSQPLIFANGTGPSAATGGQFPDVNNAYQRLEAMAKYTFDEDFVRSMGWNGKVTARLRYAWENNRVANWQTDVMQSYMYSITSNAGHMTWLALEESELQRPRDRRLALLRLVKRNTALPEEPPEAARVHQLFFAPSLIRARMASRSQIDSCFLPCGMRIAAGTFQS